MLNPRPTRLRTDFGRSARPEARAAGGVGTSSAPSRPGVDATTRCEWEQYWFWSSARRWYARGVWTIAVVCGCWRVQSSWAFASYSDRGCGCDEFKAYRVSLSSGGLEWWSWCASLPRQSDGGCTSRFRNGEAACNEFRGALWGVRYVDGPPTPTEL